jgi:hypothetical protein
VPSHSTFQHCAGKRRWPKLSFGYATEHHILGRFSFTLNELRELAAGTSPAVRTRRDGDYTLYRLRDVVRQDRLRRRDAQLPTMPPAGWVTLAAAAELLDLRLHEVQQLVQGKAPLLQSEIRCNTRYIRRSDVLWFQASARPVGRIDADLL